MRLTLAGPVFHEETIQKSRFIAKAAPVASEGEARAFLEGNREEAATHNCFAYKIGHLYRFSDDGEPAGTAGKPILHAIEAQGLDGVVVLVVRYFGGIKLGAGGLVRAYGGVAAEALRRGKKVPWVEWAEATFLVPFGELGRVYPLVRDKVVGESHGQEGVLLRLRLPQEALPSLEVALQEATRGKARRM
ncbi:MULTISPECIES: IMPACT family protein [Thermus]|uniref:Impact N-terminal domain-containing protein n=1 Tax=Thermus brockianus TaxID=56956 RepID=A0ABN6NHG5_THEBO|nr:YigZ family protein [Thermus brockianus]BDG16193.1 hypothetical protein TbrSNM41_09270 [Thermus brockianus]